MNKTIKSSARGLTFSFPANETFKMGTTVQYIIDTHNKQILISPSKEGVKVSRKKSGTGLKPLLDLRSKQVKDFIKQSDYLQIEINEEVITVSTYNAQIKHSKQKTCSSIKKHNNVIKLEDVLNMKKTSSFFMPLTILDKVVGVESSTAQIETGFMRVMESNINRQSSSNFLANQISTQIPQVIKTISLFSGAGMLDYSFSKDDKFDLVFAIDTDKSACESYKYNIGDHIHCGSVSDLKGSSLPHAKLLIGGAPCKPFSNCNRIKRLSDHEDSRLISEYIRLVRESYVDVFVLENVPQVLTASEGEYYKMLLDELQEYEVTASLIQDSKVGGYTDRKRAILVGSKIGKITIPNIKLSVKRTVKEALKKVSPDWFNYGDVTIPREDTIERMSYIPQGGNYKNIPNELKTKSVHSNAYRRLDENTSAPTLVNWRKPPLIHPTENRTLSVAEASALSGFGKDFRFYGTLASKQQQCGNGVPLAIGTLVKDAVKKAFNLFYGRQSVVSVT